ncbi:MAG: hypothetical protein Q8K89_11000 [Actinomycetota bacterium]|nr:hypothetical protein [Actinomycetota bacterium]
MKLPLDIRELTSFGERVREQRDEPVRVAVFVEIDAPDRLVEAVREHLRPAAANARVHVDVVGPGDMLIAHEAASAVVGVMGSGTHLAESIADARERAIPTVVLALASSQDEVARRVSHPLLDTLVSTEVDDLIADLATWLADRVSSKRLALAHGFAFMRRAVAEESVKTTATQNAVIGVVAVIPGADMPLMTANQAKMVLQIAAVYGEPLNAERIRELLAVVGGGFVLRTIARQALAFIPGFGWAVKGGIGYTGTLAMGYAAVGYFNDGADFGQVIAHFETMKQRALTKARRPGRVGTPKRVRPHPSAPGLAGGKEPALRPAEGLSAGAVPDEAGERGA